MYNRNSDLLLIIPAYNEAENIIHTINGIKKTCPELDYVILNDGSKDDTRDICRVNKYNMIDLPVNVGLESNFIAGVKYAYRKGYKYVMQFDADGQHRADYIYDLYDAVMDGSNIVIGSRYLDGKRKVSLRDLGSRIISIAIKMTTGKKITDPTSGMRIYDRKCMKILISDINYRPEPDTISHLIKNGLIVSEVYVKMNDRVAGNSYLNISNSVFYMIKMLISILIIQNFRSKVG